VARIQSRPSQVDAHAARGPGDQPDSAEIGHETSALRRARCPRAKAPKRSCQQPPLPRWRSEPTTTGQRRRGTLFHTCVALHVPPSRGPDTVRRWDNQFRRPLPARPAMKHTPPGSRSAGSRRRRRPRRHERPAIAVSQRRKVMAEETWLISPYENRTAPRSSTPKKSWQVADQLRLPTKHPPRTAEHNRGNLQALPPRRLGSVDPGDHREPE